MPDGMMMKSIEQGGQRYLGILEVDDVKHEKVKGQIKKYYLRRVRDILKLKLDGGNIISAINSGSESWTKMELEELDQKTRKLMAMYGAHHPKADVDRLYLQRCERGRGLVRLEDCVQVEVHNLEKYL